MSGAKRTEDGQNTHPTLWPPEANAVSDRDHMTTHTHGHRFPDRGLDPGLSRG